MRLRRPLEAGFAEDDLLVDGPGHQFHRARVRLGGTRQGGEVGAHVLLRGRGEGDVELLEAMAQDAEELVRREVLEDQRVVELVHPALGELLRDVLVRGVQLREDQGAFAARLDRELLDLQADLLHAAAVVEAGVRELRVVRVDEDQAVAGLPHGLAQDAVEERFGDVEEPLALDLGDVAVGNQAHALEDGRHDLRDGALARAAAADEPPRQEPLAHIRLADGVQVARRPDEVVDGFLDVPDARKRIEPGEGRVDGVVIEHDGFPGLSDNHVLREDGAEFLLRGMLQGGRARAQGGEDVVPDEVRHEPAVAEARGRAVGAVLDDGPQVRLGPRGEDESLPVDHLLADLQQLVRGVVLEAEHVREPAFDALVALQELLHGRGVAGQDDDQVGVLPAEFRQERVHDDAAVVVVPPFDELVGLVDEEDVASGAGQQAVHLLLGLADVLAHHPGLLRADDPALGEDAPGGEHPADDFRDGGLARPGVAEEGHVEAGRVRGQAELHPPGGETDGIQVILHPRLDLPEADQGVQLLKAVIADGDGRGDVRAQHRPERFRVRIRGGAEAPVHRGDDPLVEDAPDQQRVVEARVAVVVEVREVGFELLARLAVQAEAQAPAAGIDLLVQLVQGEVPEVDGGGNQVAQLGEGGEERVHAVRLAAQDQHPSGEPFLVREGVDERAHDKVFGFIGLSGRPGEFVRILEDEGSAAGVRHRGKGVVRGFAPDGRDEGRQPDRLDLFVIQVAVRRAEPLEEADAGLLLRAGVADEGRVQDGRIGRETRFPAGFRDPEAGGEVEGPFPEGFEPGMRVQGRETLLDGRAARRGRRFLGRGLGAPPDDHGMRQERFVVLQEGDEHGPFLVFGDAILSDQVRQGERIHMQAVPVMEDFDHVEIPAGGALLRTAAQRDFDLQFDGVVDRFRVDEVDMDILLLVVGDGPDLLQDSTLAVGLVHRNEKLVSLRGRPGGETRGEIGPEEIEDGRVVVEPVDFLVDIFAGIPEVEHQVDDVHQLLLGGVRVGEKVLGEFHRGWLGLWVQKDGKIRDQASLSRITIVDLR